MKYELHQHKFGLDIVESNLELKSLWEEFLSVIDNISDEDVLNEYQNPPAVSKLKTTKSGKTSKRPKNKMSLSAAINNLIEDGLISKNWNDQSEIFQGKEYKSKKWRLDFSKRIANPKSEITGFAVEVAFNHGEAISWNLMKPVLAAEINHVETEVEIGAGIGVYVCATKALKKEGAFDNTVGEYEKVLRYLVPLSSKLTVPMIIVGLKPLENFKLEKKFDKVTRQNSGTVVLKP
jgi:hypothetical protein